MSKILAFRTALATMGNLLPIEEEVVYNLYCPVNVELEKNGEKMKFEFEIPVDFIHTFTSREFEIDLGSYPPAKNFKYFTDECCETPNKTYIERWFSGPSCINFSCLNATFTKGASICITSGCISFVAWECSPGGFRKCFYSETDFRDDPNAQNKCLVSIQRQVSEP